MKITYNELLQIDQMVFHITRYYEITTSEIDQLIYKIFTSYNINYSKEILRINQSNDWDSIISYFQKFNDDRFHSSSIGYSISTYKTGEYSVQLNFHPFYNLSHLSERNFDEIEYYSIVGNCSIFKKEFPYHYEYVGL